MVLLCCIQLVDCIGLLFFPGFFGSVCALCVGARHLLVLQRSERRRTQEGAAKGRAGASNHAT